MKNFEIMNLSSRSTIFTSEQDDFEFCLSKGLIATQKTCECGGILSLQKDTTYRLKHRYRCLEKGCRRSKKIFEGLKIERPEVLLNDYLYVLYMWLEKNYTYNIIRNSGLSKSSVNKIKINIIDIIKKINSFYNKKLGGQNLTIQVDETIILRGKLVKSPSSMRDLIKNATWLLGAVEETSGDFILSVIPNRKKETFVDFFKRNINDETCVKTDGHKSYPSAVRAIKGENIIVNHEEGFRNSDGYSTNLIENLWSLLKTDITARKGIKKSNMKDYIEEFIFRRRYLKTKSSDEVQKTFMIILEYRFQ
jgi:hypothetical protein